MSDEQANRIRQLEHQVVRLKSVIAAASKHLDVAEDRFANPRTGAPRPGLYEPKVATATMRDILDRAGLS